MLRRPDSKNNLAVPMPRQKNDPNNDKSSKIAVVVKGRSYPISWCLELMQEGRENNPSNTLGENGLLNICLRALTKAGGNMIRSSRHATFRQHSDTKAADVMISQPASRDRYERTNIRYISERNKEDGCNIPCDHSCPHDYGKG